MTINEAEQVLKEHLELLSEDILLLLPQDGIRGMAKFYLEERLDDCDVANDGDMLLFEYGTFKFSGTAQFQIGITRQFILEGEDEPFQLKLTFFYPIARETDSYGEMNFWCFTPDELSLFIGKIEQEKPFVEMSSKKAERVELMFEQC